jgi:hypothetical protein
MAFGPLFMMVGRYQYGIVMAYLASNLSTDTELRRLLLHAHSIEGSGGPLHQLCQDEKLETMNDALKKGRHGYLRGNSVDAVVVDATLLDSEASSIASMLELFIGDDSESSSPSVRQQHNVTVRRAAETVKEALATPGHWLFKGSKHMQSEAARKSFVSAYNSGAQRTASLVREEIVRSSPPVSSGRATKEVWTFKVALSMLAQQS